MNVAASIQHMVSNVSLMLRLLAMLVNLVECRTLPTEVN